MPVYDSGKYVSSADIIIERNNLVKEEPHKALPEGQVQRKLKFNLSVPQLAYLFKLLYDFNLIDADSKAEVKRFLIANVSTKSSDEISDKSLANKLSETQKSEADYWADMLMNMYKAAKKV